MQISLCHFNQKILNYFLAHSRNLQMLAEDEEWFFSAQMIISLEDTGVHWFRFTPPGWTSLQYQPTKSVYSLKPSWGRFIILLLDYLT